MEFRPLSGPSASQLCWVFSLPGAWFAWTPPWSSPLPIPPCGKGPEGLAGAPGRSSPSPWTAGGPCKEEASGSRETWVLAPAGRSLLAALQEWLSWRYKDHFLRLILKRGSHKLLQKVQVGQYRALGWVLEVLLGQAGHIRCDCGESRRSPRTQLPCLPVAPVMQNVVLPPSGLTTRSYTESCPSAEAEPEPLPRRWVSEATGPVLCSSAMARPPRLRAWLLLHLQMGWFGSSSVQFVRPRKRVPELSSAS